MMAFKLLRKKLNSCLGNNSYEQMTVRFLFTILNWPLILISWSYHENSKQATSLRNSHATHLFGSNGFESLDYVVTKAAEISIRMFSFFSFFFVISAGFLPREPFYFLCRFRYRRTVNKTACSILWHSLSKFVLSLGSGFSRHPEGLSFSGLGFRDTQRVWVFETPRGSEFLGSEFSRHPEGLSF